MLSELGDSPFRFTSFSSNSSPSLCHCVNISIFFIKVLLLCKSLAESHFGLKVVCRLMHSVIRNELYVKPELYCIIVYIGQDFALDISSVI